MRKTSSKSIPLVLTLIMVFLTIPFNLIEANATNYNASTALSYAANHWNDVATGGSDKEECAGFVSNCITAGGISIMERGVANLYNSLINNGFGIAYQLLVSSNRIPMSSNSGKVSPGDPVFYYCNTHWLHHKQRA